MTTTYELYTNENGTPKAVEGKAPAILERVEALEEKSDDYLPLSGNIPMTGTIKSTVNNSLELVRDSGDAYGMTVERTDTNNRISFGIGSGGINRGIYDKTLDKWVVHFDADGKLKTDGKEVITVEGGTIDGRTSFNEVVYLLANLGFDNRFQLHKAKDSGTVYLENYRDGTLSSRIVLRDASDASNPGDIEIQAKNATDNCTLLLKPNNTIAWGGRKIPRIVEIMNLKTPAVASKANATSVINYTVEKKGNRFIILQREGDGTHWATLGYRVHAYTDTGFSVTVYNRESSTSSQCQYKAFVFEY